MNFGDPSEEHRRMMTAVFRNAETVEEMEQFAVLYILDERFSREDIAQVMGEMTREIKARSPDPPRTEFLLTRNMSLFANNS